MGESGPRKSAEDPWREGSSSSEAGAKRGAGAAAGDQAERPEGGEPGPSSPKAKPATPAFDPSNLASGLGMLEKIGDSLREPGPYEAPQRSADFDADKPHWWVLTLSGAVVERESFSWSGGSGIELAALQERLAQAAGEEKLLGVVLRFADLELSFPDALEVRAAIKKVRAAGRRVVCHSHGTGNVEYLVMSACDRVGMAPLGQVAITGPAALPVHLRPLLARFGVVADFLHVGAYKGAAEPFTHDAPSAQSREVLGQILDQHYQTMVEIIATERGLTQARVKELIDVGLHAPQAAQQAKLVDQVGSFEELRDAEVRAPWTHTTLSDGEATKSPMQAMAELMRFLGATPAQRPTHPHVAVVYAVGNIIDGSGEGLLGARQEIAAATLAPALRALAADDSVKAVVLRVDSGGGSAQASELIWKEMKALRAKKPVVVSMSDVAASGGYYISCGATKIYAEPDTLTGSIGVVGGRLAFGAALAQQGVRTYPMGRGKRATMAQSLTAWTAEERTVIQAMMDDVYGTFLARVAQGRGKTLEQIHALAQGRVWTGAKAKELGLVDELGGLAEAIAEAEKLGQVPASAEREIFPPSPTLRDLAVSFGQVQVGGVGALLGARAGASAALDLLSAMDPQVAAAARSLLAQLATFRTSAVQAVAYLPRVR
ncbi:MAG: signal peptide peptidase SppA [Myxococcales bacterium]|nr:signal peptide peptidase SppA [Myxococcales bacterium]